MFIYLYSTFNKKKKEILYDSDYIANKKTIIPSHKKLKNYSNPGQFKIIIFFALIFLLLFKKTLQDNYIGIKVKYSGINQIISDEYSNLPSNVYIGSTQKYLDNKRITVDSSEQNELIKLSWGGLLSNLSNMFKGLTNIIYVEMQDILYHSSSEKDLSYMFYNCTNLSSITCTSSYMRYIKSMKGMFYNCISLVSVSFSSFSGYSSYYYVDFSYMFYNCKSFNTSINFNNYRASDTSQMFYNCISLGSFNYYPDNTYNPINMTKMFYNCTSITSILFSCSGYFRPNDMSFMFYNCNSLKSLTLNDLLTENTKYMAYMLYNCKNLTYFYLEYTLYNSNVKDMRGVFQNCESIVTLDLTKFYTPKVEIMWDMFKGCKNLQVLKTPNVVTSSVTDMQSMFNGCSSLVTLDLRHFKTSNVQYMNKMFKNCEKLEYLYLNQFTTESLGTMHRMFYNCTSLKYLNIYNIIEDIQSITEILEGTPDNFTLCIKDEKNIPNIFDIIKRKQNTTRDCTTNCYPDSNFRIYSSVSKQCCDKTYYDDKCYDTCPGRTRRESLTIRCSSFNCPGNNYYYNYEQNNCQYGIQEGFYLNDSSLKTIDKCDSNCRTCTQRATKCLTCYNDVTNRYLYLSKCISNCEYDIIPDSSSFPKCYCYERKCKFCSEERMELNLCVSCNTNMGYYPKSDEASINGFINCYKGPEGYYLVSSISKYKPCYPS